MLIALATLLILHFGFGHNAVMEHLDQVEKRIERDVADKGHRKQALAIVDRMKTLEKEQAKRHEKDLESLDKLLQKREVSAGALQQSKKNLMEEHRAAREKMLDLRFQLKSALDANDWARVFPPPKSAAPSSKKSG